MSSDKKSKIFDAFNNYFIQYSKHTYIISEKPIKENTTLYHYHRPNMETTLFQNSIVTVHHDLEDTDEWLNIETFIQRYKEAKHIVCLNTIQQNILAKNNILHTTVIPHGYRDDIFEKKKLKLYDKKDKITLGIVSKRYDRRVKGEAYLLELLKRLDNSKFKFILVGEGRGQDAILLARYGFEVETFTNLPYILYPEVYKKIDFLLMISLFEGGPANLPEALASGVPVITNNIAMAHDMIQEFENGLFLSGEYDDDVAKINSLTHNNGALFDTLQTNLQKNQNILSWKEVVAAYEKIYTKIKDSFEA